MKCEYILAFDPDEASLLSWERGLKSSVNAFWIISFFVAPLVGAWIEIGVLILFFIGLLVAPLVGAWIEIRSRIIDLTSSLSLLSWERGLKFLPPITRIKEYRRSSRGSVD